LIDFDYAVVAEPILDLASLVVMNSLSRAEETELLNAYFAGGELPFSAQEFARVQRLVRLLAHFWSLASNEAETAIVARYRIEDV
jgi:thiamine kinase-like enzyme